MQGLTFVLTRPTVQERALKVASDVPAPALLKDSCTWQNRGHSHSPLTFLCTEKGSMHLFLTQKLLNTERNSQGTVEQGNLRIASESHVD